MVMEVYATRNDNHTASINYSGELSKINVENALKEAVDAYMRDHVDSKISSTQFAIGNVHTKNDSKKFGYVMVKCKVLFNLLCSRDEDGNDLFHYESCMDSAGKGVWSMSNGTNKDGQCSKDAWLSSAGKDCLEGITLDDILNPVGMHASERVKELLRMYDMDSVHFTQDVLEVEKRPKVWHDALLQVWSGSHRVTFRPAMSRVQARPHSEVNLKVICVPNTAHLTAGQLKECVSKYVPYSDEETFYRDLPPIATVPPLVVESPSCRGYELWFNSALQAQMCMMLIESLDIPLKNCLETVRCRYKHTSPEFKGSSRRPGGRGGWQGRGHRGGGGGRRGGSSHRRGCGDDYSGDCTDKHRHASRF